MPGKKTIVWSGKINLGNYESLGFEVSGEVETPDEALDLALFEAGQLIGLANRANPATAETLRSYVARVFGVQEEDLPKGPRREDPAIYESKPVHSTPAKDTGTEAVSRQQHADKLMADLSRLQADHNTRVAASKPDAVQTPAVTLDQVSPLPARMPAPAVPPAAPAAPPAPAPAPAKPAAPTVATCEKCGAGITESQRKMSQLFTSKTLCKKCMEAP